MSINHPQASQGVSQQCLTNMLLFNNVYTNSATNYVSLTQARLDVWRAFCKMLDKRFIVIEKSSNKIPEHL